MLIRKAFKNENLQIAQLIFIAMEEIIYDFIGVKDEVIALDFLSSLVVQTNNQYSYENCWVVEQNDLIIALALVYDGADILSLRKNVEEQIKNQFQKDFNLENETQAGEIYIDCLGVSPDFQGKGVGSYILNFLIGHYVVNQKKTLGLLVDNENNKAMNLYLKLGFINVGHKVLAGKVLEHLQREPSIN